MQSTGARTILPTRDACAGDVDVVLPPALCWAYPASGSVALE
jgi:hypothetical protein